jgi:hypothetical protein
MWNKLRIMVKMRTPQDVIAMLGGNARTAKLTGRGGKAVSNWKRRGIPLATRHVIEPALRKLGFIPDPRVWAKAKYRLTVAQR